VIVSAGLVRVLTAACPELAAAIKQQQQQQQSADDAAKESLLCTRLVAAAALQVLRRCILADRPAQVRDTNMSTSPVTWMIIQVLCQSGI
jgi:hypothetical protein